MKGVYEIGILKGNDLIFTYPKYQGSWWKTKSMGSKKFNVQLVGLIGLSVNDEAYAL